MFCAELLAIESDWMASCCCVCNAELARFLFHIGIDQATDAGVNRIVKAADESFLQLDTGRDRAESRASGGHSAENQFDTCQGCVKLTLGETGDVEIIY